MKHGLEIAELNGRSLAGKSNYKWPRLITKGYVALPENIVLSSPSHVFNMKF
jgi:hypothetical protein